MSMYKRFTMSIFDRRIQVHDRNHPSFAFDIFWVRYDISERVNVYYRSSRIMVGTTIVIKWKVGVRSDRESLYDLARTHLRSLSIFQSIIY